jgi:hypothetical protein
MLYSLFRKFRSQDWVLTNWTHYKLSDLEFHKCLTLSVGENEIKSPISQMKMYNFYAIPIIYNSDHNDWVLTSSDVHYKLLVESTMLTPRQ